MKKTYLVIACSKCERFLLARQGTKARQCPYCGTRMKLSKTEVLWMTSDLEEARSVLHSKRQSLRTRCRESRGWTSTHF